MAKVVYEQATLVYPGAKAPTVNKFDLEIADGEFLVLVGPSGCGKSTTLRMLAGLEDVTEGRILIGDRDVTTAPPKERDIAMVFQNYALYPHMTVRENMGFALKIAGVDKAEIDKRVDEAAKTLDLTEYLDRKPKALSGGQRQRVAMGRAIVRKPQVFLMDEPLSNLDAKLRVQTRTQIASLQRKLGVTTLYVTHDQTEALTMGDRIAVLKDGYLQQVGTPRELYDTPANVFVAGFIGSPAMNIFTFTLDGDIATLGDARVTISEATRAAVVAEDNGKITIGFRPEALEIVDDTVENSIPLVLDFVEELGSDSFLYGHIVGADDQQIVIRALPNVAPPRGSVMHVRVVESGQHNFAATSGKRLP
ncbi:sn-glycerol-3-phosphate ABC transporter ATP-binding protein UgpC [Corynebacterium felinum]|uniref:Multiple sugar transport system ATP-binding protein n=1 Tax=Corynebacterium felinum TaxID=131318 RepID=A0ABU2B7M2_9CORY|nr:MULTISPECIES: sn-glycerol-3-phosphate ABC transporter ATP-binding protein UgpC [Corynebacterium]MDF5820880.1 sn-glycerol-3-phosphate ABC transporter ATP-binding protein UgpC [Corynebacterium felinum]MDO4761749.1 sn-glycerol-3-phosphate ABC transporter ATP-binding protein UgpC [Corynebacterium sp.]MDR7354608.1 multiple sugar transport system ATP-binding protein [Corynebacterium felinum]WJY93973.1 Trehalose import ATP-binding protein SugC [Corynebacterium felinum]